MTYDVAIIGAGIVGCFLARELSQYNLNVIVLEKDNDVGNEASMANSAIVHSGYDPIENTLKAKLNVLGNAMFDKICEELDVKFSRIGSLTLAFNEKEVETLKMLQQRAFNNGVDVEILTYEQIKQIEPFVNENVKAGLYAKTAGIVDPFNLCIHAMENAIDNGVTLILNENINKIIKENDLFILNNKYQSKVVINCAGINADEINNLVNKETFKIISRKGQYYVLNHFKDEFVKHTLFMVPSDKGKGVLISPTTSGNYLIGPSAEETNKFSKSTDLKTLDEVAKQANLMVDKIPYYQTIRTFAGLRATPSTHDFIIQESDTKNFINVAGIESPGLTSSPAIAKMVVEDIVSKMLPLTKKENYNPKIKKYIKIKELTLNEKKKMFAIDKDYGTIICKCEQVSLGEIKDCLSRSCPPHSIKALKKRLRVGFGKCQGGMCQAEALSVLAKFYKVDKKDIMYDNLNSYILYSKTKGEN